MKLPEKAKTEKIWSVLAFLIPFVGMLMVMLISKYRPFGKYSMLYSDMYHQYYPFFVSFRDALRSGDSLLYNWSIGMGVDYLGLISYYLASPLNLLSVLVPESILLDYFSLLMPIKLGLASLFFSIFLRKIFGRNDFSISVFGGFYGLCAWALGYQWNVMWLDTFALLPLVTLGTVSLIRDRKFVLYTLTLFLSIFANYYIGFFTCIFVALVFFCYEICRFRGWKTFFLDLLRIAFFSLLAICMSMILTVPALAALQTTQSSVNKFPTTFRLNIAGSNTIFGLLDAMRSVAGNMGGGLEPTFKEGLPNLYCGVGTLFLAILYLLSDDEKARDKLCAVFLLLFFNVSFIIRQLDYIWHGFHFTNMIPYRFSFLYSFVMLYMAYSAWTHRKHFDGLQVGAAFFLTAALLCCSDSLTSTVSAELFGEYRNFPVYILYNVPFLILSAGAVLYGSLRPSAREDTEEEQQRVRQIRRERLWVSGVVLLAAASLELIAAVTAFGLYFPGTSVSNYPKGKEEAASMIRYMKERERNTLFFRAETTHSQTLNDGALNHYNGISAFTSSANVHITEFTKALGYGAKNTYNRYCFEESSPVANLFLDLKYMIERDGKDKSGVFFEDVHHYGSVHLLKNNAYLPLGFLAEPELADVDFASTVNAFAFQNDLFCAATGESGSVWRRIEGDNLVLTGYEASVNEENGKGYCSYSDCQAGAVISYFYIVPEDGFACIHLDLPKRNEFCILKNGEELYKENISLPQMLAVGDVLKGESIEIRIECAAGESGTMTVMAAVLDNEMFFRGYDRLGASALELTSFRNTALSGIIDCDRDGLLYTSIPQNGNWHAYVDGAEVEPELIGDCMIGLPLVQGKHTVSFAYRNPAVKIGGLLSFTGFAVFFASYWYVYRPDWQKLLRGQSGHFQK